LFYSILHQIASDQTCNFQSIRCTVYSKWYLETHMGHFVMVWRLLVAQGNNKIREKKPQRQHRWPSVCAWIFLVIVCIIDLHSSTSIAKWHSWSQSKFSGTTFFHASISNHILLIQIKTALQVQIFRKSLLLSRVAAGNIVNMVSNDCQKVADACTNLQYLWSAVIEVIGKQVLFILS